MYVHTPAAYIILIFIIHIHNRYSYLCINVTEGKFRRSKRSKRFFGFGLVFVLLREKSGKSVCDTLLSVGSTMHNFRLCLQKASVVEGLMLSFIFLLYDQF